MKKLLSFLVLSSIIIPVLVAAQAPVDGCDITHDFSHLTNISCPDSGEYCAFDDANHDCGMCCLLNTIETITDWIFVILITLVVLMVLWGGINIVTAGSDPAKVQAGRTYIIYAAVGLAVAFLSRAIPAVVTSLLGA